MSANQDFYFLNKHSRLFLSRGYLKENQSAEERYLEIAKSAEKILKIKGFADKFYNYCKKGYYSLASPVFSNFGNERGLPVSCFNCHISDTMESILEKAAEVGMESKMGGGTSGYFGDLRPRGSKVSVGGESSGSVNFLELYDTVSNIVSQGSTRRGSFAAYLPIEHADIEEFLLIRSEGHPIQNTSIAITITDKWLEEMLAGDKKKRQLWAKVIKKRFETGYPYISFIDSINNQAPQVYKDKGMKIKSQNLCVASETLILTKNGHQIISELENQEAEIWNGKEWSKTKIIKTGTDQKLLKVILSDGKSLECTEYHKWYIINNYGDQEKGNFEIKATKNLVAGDKLIKFDNPIVDGSEDFESPYSNGLFSAEGTYERSGRKRLSLYGEKQNLLQFLDCQYQNNGFDNSGRLNIILLNEFPPKFTVPLNSSVQSRLKWFEGLCDGDGTIARNKTFDIINESLQICSIEKEFLLQVQLMLQLMGINSKVTKSRDSGYRFLPNNRNGEMDSYFCQTAYRLLINSNELYKLSLLGFSPKRLKYIPRLPQREASQFVKVVEVLDGEVYKDTYCVNEPKEHKAVFNGILTGNCNEIALVSDENNSFVCVLSSLNLIHWDEIKETDAVETLIYFLDAVNEEFIHKTKDMKFMNTAHNFAKTQRALGAGVLGWHHLLQSKNIPFESMAAKYLNIEIWKTIRERADKATEELAKLFGEPELLKGYGRRNVTTLAVAPTTSSSFILGQVSQSIEPLESNYFVNKTAKGSFTYKNPFLRTLLEKYDKDEPSVWESILIKGGSVQHLKFLTEEEKNIFKTFEEISQKEIIIQAAGRQKYIDQSQSLNIKIHPKVSPKEVSELMLEAHRLGVKGLYYQRSMSATRELNRNLLGCASCEG